MRPNFLEGTFQGPTVTRTRVIATAVLFCTLFACDESKSPTAPDLRPAAIIIENVSTAATAPTCCARGSFTYRVSLTLRETTGVGATISGITATLTEISGATTVRQFSSADVFGTNRIAANGALTANNITSTGPLLTVSEVAVRVTFTKDNGNTGAAQTSTGLRFDLTGDWTGPLQIRTQPMGDWSLARASVVESGDSLTGELVSRDGVRFLLNGSVSGDWAPLLSLGGLPGTSTCGGVWLVITQFEFMSGRVQRLSGHASGRCFGTVTGNFELQRGT